MLYRLVRRLGSHDRWRYTCTGLNMTDHTDNNVGLMGHMGAPHSGGGVWMEPVSIQQITEYGATPNGALPHPEREGFEGILEKPQKRGWSRETAEPMLMSGTEEFHLNQSQSSEPEGMRVTLGEEQRRRRRRGGEEVE
ncbi:hypothetical protein EYF80_009592 [Liparis tanakae]|uniref:Uncharacterized protein n=1 Tax=Liparis tanakae TaxID=230148 RepID=A0A4Z2IR74_9TELE|nr:hypothetical protein EYF80_009592 [Liparis tanakae]